MKSTQKNRDLIWKLGFEQSWKICKAHKKFKGQPKSTFRESRPGMAMMMVLDLYEAGMLTKEEKKLIGI